MDLSKFLSLIKNRSLFFSRLDKLEDQHEGSFSKAHGIFLDEMIKLISVDNSEKLSARELLTEADRRQRAAMYIRKV